MTARLLLAALSALLMAAAPPDRPNIVFILIDDLRHDEMGFLGSPVPTPEIDRLAREGTHFANAFVTTSLCSPSRASLLTGLAMRNHGVVDNNVPLSRDLAIFPQRLQQAGYATALVGKWHMGGNSAEPRPGFDHWVSFPGQGSYGPVDLLGHPSMFNVNGEAVPQRGYITDELTDYALDWIGEQDGPFFLYLSHKAVHAPFRPADRHRETLTAEAPDLSGTRSGDEEGVPLWVQNQRNSWHGIEFAYHASLELGAFIRDYRETLRAVDDSIGRLRAALEAEGIADDTIIVLTSDNGFMLGEQGLIDKRNAYEPSMRIPLLVHGPGRIPAGITRSGMVANVDVAPTLLDFAGAQPLADIDGTSFAAAAFGSQADESARRMLVYEYYWEFNYPQTPTTFALRDEQWKYIQYHGVWDVEELFDLENDPHETRNLITDPEHQERLIAMRAALFDGLAARGGERSIRFSRKFNQGAVFRRRDGSRSARFPDRWLREDDAWDRLEHAIPDGPGKPVMIDALNRALGERD